MIVEKTEAAQASMFAATRAHPVTAAMAAMAPWLDSTRANAKRLRRKR